MTEQDLIAELKQWQGVFKISTPKSFIQGVLAAFGGIAMRDHLPALSELIQQLEEKHKYE